MGTGASTERASYVERIAAEGARVCEVARIGPLDARVPHLRRWRLSDVVAHLGGVHRWAAAVVTERSMSVGRRRGREQGEALVAWFEEGVDHLVSVLAATDLDEPCPNFSPGSANVVAFWARRQAHETTMHRWDAEAANGHLTPIDAAFATDGIDELFATFTRSRGGQALDAPVLVTTTDTDTTWLVSPAEKPGRVEVHSAPETDSEAAAALSGPAEQVLLALWKRLDLATAEVVVSGRPDVVERFVAGPVSP
jgi:uncharacterized protein (TIGR03083 family)